MWYVMNITRRSADADKYHDAFSGQSRSTNIVAFHILDIYCRGVYITDSVVVNLGTYHVEVFYFCFFSTRANAVTPSYRC